MSIDTKLEIPLARIFDQINDDFACVRRLLSRPEVCISAPEIMDVIRLAIDQVHHRYESFAMDVRIRSGQTLAERDRCSNIVRKEREGWDSATLKADMCDRLIAKIDEGTRL